MPSEDEIRSRVRNKGFWGWVEYRVLLLKEDPERRARAWRIAWWVSTLFVLVGFGVMAYLLFSGQAAAAAAPGLVPAFGDVDVTLVQAEDADAWTVTQRLTFTAGNASGAAYWFPVDAQNQRLRLVGTDAEPLGFTVIGDGRAIVHWEEDATPSGVIVQFTVHRPAGDLPEFRAPAPVDALAITLHLQPGHAPPGGDAAWTRVGDGEWRYEAVDVAADARVPLTPARPTPDAGPGAVASVAGFALVALVAGAAYSARRTPRVPADADVGLLDHLRELQSRLVIVIAFLAAYALLFFSTGIANVTVAGVTFPFLVFDVTGSVSAGVFHVLAHRFVPEGVGLVVLRPVDAALTQLLVAVFLAVVAVVPLGAWQTSAFLAPALLAEERKLLARAVLPAVLLFVAGLAFAYYVIVPVAMRLLYGYAAGLGATTFLTVNDLVGFSVVLLLVFGVSFQLPVIMAALARLGVVSAAWFRSKWRHAVVVIFLLGGLLTPDPTWVTQVLLAVPLSLLYVAGVVAARMVEKSGRGADGSA